MSKKRTAFIVIDNGFSASCLARAKRILAICDLSRDAFIEGDPLVSAETLAAFAVEEGSHGSIVLDSLLDHAGDDAAVILVRAWGVEGLIRTGWQNNKPVRKGWVEAYLWAVDVCRRLGYNSVANCSFGGVPHAADGTGWESWSMGAATGHGKAGHIVVAAAGPGDGRAVHASANIVPGSGRTITAYQQTTTDYNFWAPRSAAWELVVKVNGRPVFQTDHNQVPVNGWNQRKQQTLTIGGAGWVTFSIACGATACAEDFCAAGFEIFAEGDGVFTNHVDPTFIAEPACFPGVLSAGLRCGQYSPTQTRPEGKPDVLLPGDGAISFRIPELVAAIGRLLESDPTLDVDGCRKLLGKYPNLKSVGR